MPENKSPKKGMGSKQGSTDNQHLLSSGPTTGNISVWSSTCNDTIALTFEQELNKLNASHQSFDHDFDLYCVTRGIIRCPSIRMKIDHNEKENEKISIYIKDVMIDIANWDMMILACISSSVSSIFIHGVSLAKKHLADLFLGITKLDHIIELNLDYLTLQELDLDLNATLPAVFSCNANSISLRGNKLNDSFLISASTLLGANMFIKAINLAGNCITDTGASVLFENLKFNPCLKFLSFRSNLCEGDCVTSLFNILGGSVMHPSDIACLKTITSAVATRNKKVKELLKKGNISHGVEPEEVPSPDTRVYKIGTESYISNRCLVEVDFSWNPISLVNIVLAGENMVASTSYQACIAPYELTVTLKGAHTDSVHKSKLDALSAMSIAAEGKSLTFLL